MRPEGNGCHSDGTGSNVQAADATVVSRYAKQGKYLVWEKRGNKCGEL